MLTYFLLLRHWKRVENVPLPKFDFDFIFFLTHTPPPAPENNKDRYLLSEMPFISKL